MLKLVRSEGGPVITVQYAGLWTFLFGIFYLMYKQAWVSMLVYAALVLCTMGVAHFIVPLFIESLMKGEFENKGWHVTKV